MLFHGSPPVMLAPEEIAWAPHIHTLPEQSHFPPVETVNKTSDNKPLYITKQCNHLIKKGKTTFLPNLPKDYRSPCVYFVDNNGPRRLN